MIVVLMSQCTAVVQDRKEFAATDTTRLVQVVLNDKKLESELIKDFGDQQLKFVAGSVIKKKYNFVFAGKPVEIIPVKGDIYEIREQHPEGLYVSVPTVNLFPTDSATVSFIFHAGNATALFFLKKKKEKWVIVDRRYGKF